MDIRRMRARVTDARGTVLADTALMSADFQECAVIAGSIAFFNDPEPCMIHRSAVMKRAMEEMRQALEESGAKSCPLPPELSAYLCNGTDCRAEVYVK